MSKANDYLVEQIRERDRTIEALLSQQYEDKALAWDAGWHEHFLEMERQKTNPAHPITHNNPFEEPR